MEEEVTAVETLNCRKITFQCEKTIISNILSSFVDVAKLRSCKLIMTARET